MWSNDIASVIQTQDKITIVLNEPYRLRDLRLDSEETLMLLALYTSYIREKLKSETTEAVVISKMME